MKQRGYLMPLALMVLALLGVITMGILGSKSSNYAAVVRNIALDRARALAFAGVEDARVKLMNDSYFPPPGDVEQHRFSYGELVNDVGGGGSLGRFTVTVDTEHVDEPYYVVKLTSTGTEFESNTSLRLRVELDVAPFDRKDPSRSSRFPYGVLNWTEEGLGN